MIEKSLIAKTSKVAGLIVRGKCGEKYRLDDFVHLLIIVEIYRFTDYFVLLGIPRCFYVHCRP